MAETVFNEGSIDGTDFRIESDTNVNMFFVDGADNRVGIGTSSPAAALTIKGGSSEYVNIGTATESVSGRKSLNIMYDTSANMSKLQSHHQGSAYTPIALQPNAGLVVVGSTVDETRVGQNLALTAHGGTNRGGMAINCFLASNNGPLFDFNKSRNSTAGSHTVVQDDDALGTFIWRGDDGDEFLDAAAIEANVDGTPGNGDMPGRLVFYTSADGGSSLTERMRITSTGYIVANGATDTGRVTRGNVFRSSANGKAAITLLSPSNVTAGVGNEIVALNFAANNYWADAKDSVYAQIRCEGGHGSYGDRGQLVLATGYDGDTVNDRMLIAEDGNVGIGEDDPANLLNIKRADDSYPLLHVNQNGNSGGILLNMHDVTTARSIECMNSSETTQWYIRMSGDYSLGSSVSDKDLKKDINDIPNGSLELVNKLNPKTFKWKESENRGDTTKTGFIAQDIAGAFGLNEGMATGTDGEKDMGIDTTGIVAHLTKAVQELSAEVEDLKKKNVMRFGN
tara:strand:- start:5966 stop:7495 length:1530 start_codon:yes stop_codon:yes gene_type:complete